MVDEKEVIWVEKYRPRTLDEIVNQKDIVNRLKAFVAKKSMPNLIFSGPAGTGKTTCAYALARGLYGDDLQGNILELNASDERGIETIRTRVKDFARSSVLGDVPFKLLILDEADNMTADAQQALRRTMERYSRNTRFILDCNYSSKIIEPIQSRCAIFRFKPLLKDDLIAYLKKICENENVEATQEGLDAVYYVSEGDMRKAINVLEAAASLNTKITPDVIYQVTGMARPEEVREMIDLAFKGKFAESRSKLRALLIDYGLSGDEILKQIFNEALKLPIDEKLKVQITESVGETEYRVTQGASEDIQLTALLAKLVYIGAQQK
ncbi:MAG: replication factor C small subunit [Candidatus Odinarchaeum yellowstonii]|uniref:Replication factor C small subunit n=1 Tax=Odinarchaeota yellowstonii (strain LCB_4) TaxID=1841599 RepID=A0AAF0D3C7_ODILC|nr:MAG: replication factor C small subunit [Candidatus Odinarchaeum yellowstonii]